MRHRLHNEVDLVIDGKTPVTQQVLADLPELHRVIAETLRLYPPAWLVTRLVATDTDLAGYRLPPGTAVALSPYTIHRDPHHYPNPGAVTLAQIHAPKGLRMRATRRANHSTT